MDRLAWGPALSEMHRWVNVGVGGAQTEPMGGWDARVVSGGEQTGQVVKWGSGGMDKGAGGIWDKMCAWPAG